MPGRRRSIGQVSAVAMVALFTTGCGGGSSAAETEPVAPGDDEMGRSLYAEFCASCHDADGSGGVGPALSEGRAADRVGGVREISAIIAAGSDRMPGLQARLTPEQIESIARYVRDRL